MFLSQRPNNDPEKWLAADQTRTAAPGNWHSKFDPRPEFTQTRDPKPWFNTGAMAFPWRSRGREDVSQSSICSSEWLPRHEEFDTPVNPILTEFRSTWTSNYREGAQNWLIYIDGSWGIKSIEHSTVQQRDHARRVLHLLAVISE